MSRANLALVNLEMTGWPEPIPIDGGDPPPFPVDVLPKLGREMVEYTADMIQVDPALPASSLLSVYAMSTQRRVTVTAGPIHEQTSLWACVVAEPSERKSEVFRRMKSPVHDYEQMERRRLMPLIATREAMRKTIESRVSRLEKDAGNAGEQLERELIAAEIARLHCELEENPPIRELQMTAERHTEQALFKVMVQNGEKIAIISDEPTLFAQLAGTTSRPVHLDIMKGWGGEQWTENTITRGHNHMVRPQITICIASQPGPVVQFMNNKHFEERGLLTRFLMVPCRDMNGERTWHGREWDTRITQRYREHIQEMLCQTQERELKPTTEAMNLFAYHYNSLNERQKPGKDLAKSTWAGKQPGRVLRLAAILHCGDGQKSDEIPEEVMHRAVRISEYTIEAYQFVLGMARETGDTKKLRLLLDWILAQGKPSVSFRDILSATEGRNQTNKYIQLGGHL